MRENLVGRNDLRRQVKTILFACLVFVMGMMLLATDAAKGEDSQLTQPEYTDFYNTQYYYNKLKTSVEADPVRNTYNCFDANIDCVKAAMGIGVNFGNELDWNWGMDNDLPTRQRRYTIRISIGYEDAAGEKEYYYYEQPVNAAGNIYTYQNREKPSQNHAKIKFEKNPSVTMDDSSPINFVKLKVSNSYNKALNKDFTVNVKTLRLYDSNARKLISSDESVLKRHNVRVISSTEWTTVFSKTIDSTVGAFSWNDRILQADIQLENFVSDYTGRPGLIYEHSHNQKLVHKGSGDSATVDTGKLGTLLRVLKRNGVKTIRLPITWYCHMDSTGTIDSEWLAEIKKVVDAMVAEGFYVIINIHHDTGEKGWIKADSKLFNEYQWTYRYLCLQLAQCFKMYGDHLIMQGPNEVLNYNNYKTYATNPGAGTGPITDEEYGVMNQLNNIFVEEVRRAGYNNKNRILLCNTYFSARLNLPKYVMPSDTASNKILVGIHDYTIRTDENNYGLLSSLEWLSSGGYKYLDPEGEYKYNILMDEFGIYKTENLDKRKALMNTSVPASYQLGIPMIIWDEGGDYAVMKKDGAQWDESTNSDQVAEAMIGKAEENALSLHDFGEATYSWSSNKKTCTANRKCIRQGCSHNEEEMATTSAEITNKATCEEAGEITYTANFSNEAFGTQITKTDVPAKGHSPDSSITENVIEPTCESAGSHDEVVYCSACKIELSRETKTDKALGHEWGEAAYTWNEEKTECTATRVCNRDESHTEEETSEPAKETTKEATCEEAGEITYTANFSNEAFETQEAETPIPALGHIWGEPTYTWSGDKSKCTAKRVCNRDESHTEEETSEPTKETTKEATCEEDGEITYTAIFNNTAFKHQSAKTNVPAKGHMWDEGVITRQPTGKMEGVKEYHCTVCGEVKTELLPRLPAGTDVNQKGSDGTALGEGASEAAAEKAITEMKSDSDPAGSKFNMLQFRSVKQAKSSVTVTWKKVKNAKKYLLYGNACGKKNKMKKIATISAGKKSYVVKKAAGKKVKKGTYYKFLMVAVDGNGNVISTSKVIHVASKGGKVGNHESVTITAKVNAKGKAIKKYKALSKTVIKKGKKITLKGKLVPASKKLKVKKHRSLVYESSNPKVAKISGKGVVKALKKGTATIYAYAQNGVFKSVKITVK